MTAWSSARRQPSGGWWGLRPRIGRGRGERVLMPDERRGRHNTDPGPLGGVAQLVVRLAIGGLLVAFAYDKAIDAERLAEYAAGLGTGPLPASAAAAVLVYGQLAAGIAIAIGLLTRPVALAAAVLAVAALVMTESGGVFVMWIAPLATLAGAAFLVLRGAGRLSLDGLRSGR